MISLGKQEREPGYTKFPMIISRTFFRDKEVPL